MDAAARREAYEIAREAVAAAVRGRIPAEVNPASPELREERGAFVTIKRHGCLRGCIGQFVATRPLFEMIQEMGVAAATRDPRFTFEPIRPEELPELTIDVSVLGPLEKLDDPLDFEVGVHGVYIRRGGATGCYLPQVATEAGWSKEEFLSSCAGSKAHLSRDAWRDAGTDVYRFTCDVIGEDA
jgi:AmmeMemoRadiSam system protein A